jgi:hypothetical protein
MIDDRNRIFCHLPDLEINQRVGVSSSKKSKKKKAPREKKKSVGKDQTRHHRGPIRRPPRSLRHHQNRRFRLSYPVTPNPIPIQYIHIHIYTYHNHITIPYVFIGIYQAILLLTLEQVVPVVVVALFWWQSSSTRWNVSRSCWSREGARSRPSTRTRAGNKS